MSLMLCFFYLCSQNLFTFNLCLVTREIAMSMLPGNYIGADMIYAWPYHLNYLSSKKKQRKSRTLCFNMKAYV